MKKKYLCLLVMTAFLACGGGKPRTAPGQLRPGSAEYLANQGVQHLNDGRLDLAAASLLEALRKNPRYVPARTLWGWSMPIGGILPRPLKR